MEIKTAAALEYNPGEGIPRLLVKGRGEEALRIMAAAKEAGVEIAEEPALAFLLDTAVDEGDYIPWQCWEAAAKVLSFVFAKEGR